MRKIEYKNIVIIAFIITLGAFFYGYFLPAKYSVMFMDIVKNYLSKVHFSFFGIFINNLTAACLILLGGFIFAIPSLASYFFNMMILGIASKIYSSQGQILQFLVSVVPHGIFEIPAVFISFVLGLSLTWTLIQFISKRNKRVFLQTINSIGITFAKLVLPLLIIAAVVETYVTPRLIALVK